MSVGEEQESDGPTIDDAARLIDGVVEQQLDVGEVLCAAGERLAAVYQVRHGQLGVFVDGDTVVDDGGESAELRIGELGVSAFVGEITALTGGAATATVRAEVPTTVAVIPLPAYAAWLAEHPDAAEQVAAIARERSNRSRTAVLVGQLTGINDGTAIDRILDIMTWEVLGADKVLFEQGDEADAAYIVVNGRVRINAEPVDGKGGVDLEVGRGALVGELGIIEDVPRSATVRAVRDTTLARISREQFEVLAVTHPATVVRIVRTILLEARNGAAPLSRPRSMALAFTAEDAQNATDNPAGNPAHKPAGNPADETVGGGRSRADFVGLFTTEIERFGGLVRFSAEVIESVLGRSGAALATVGTLQQQRLSELLHEAEAGTDYLLFEVSHEGDAWSQRSLRYTDRLLIVTSADPDSAERLRIEALVAAADAIPGITVWIIKAYDGEAQPFGAAQFLSDDRIHDVMHLQSSDDTHIQRLARLSSGNGVGVVFGGGGARGFAHVGVIQALHELGVPIDAVAGASIGSVAAGAYAIGIPPAELPAVAQQFFHNLKDYTIPVVALLRSARINANIDEAFGPWQVENTWLPMACVSTNISTAKVEIHRTGSLADSIRSSVAIPGVLPPVTADGHLLVDGGVLENLPVDILADDDRIGTVIALDASAAEHDEGVLDFASEVSGFKALAAAVDPRKDSYPSAVSTVVRSLLVASSRRRDEVLESGKIDLYIAYELPEVGLMDFETVESTAAAGYRASKPLIAEWLANDSED